MMMMNSLIKRSSKNAMLLYKSLNQASFDCDNCHKSLENPQCKACHRMVNYFKVFEIPQGYKVDSTVINERAKQLQKEFHPDKNTEKQEQMDKIVEYSAYINDAKSTLIDDLKRAVYMMELKGVKIQDESDIQDTSFMTEMFELQEEIQDADTGKEQVEIKNRIENVLKEVKRDLNVFFQSEDLQKCKNFVFKYKYLHRALENVKAKMP